MMKSVNFSGDPETCTEGGNIEDVAKNEEQKKQG